MVVTVHGPCLHILHVHNSHARMPCARQITVSVWISVAHSNHFIIDPRKWSCNYRVATREGGMGHFVGNMTSLGSHSDQNNTSSIQTCSLSTSNRPTGYLKRHTQHLSYPWSLIPGQTHHDSLQSGHERLPWKRYEHLTLISLPYFINHVLSLVSY